MPSPKSSTTWGTMNGRPASDAAIVHPSRLMDRHYRIAGDAGVPPVRPPLVRQRLRRAATPPARRLGADRLPPRQAVDPPDALAQDPRVSPLGPRPPPPPRPRVRAGRP